MPAHVTTLKYSDFWGPIDGVKIGNFYQTFQPCTTFSAFFEFCKPQAVDSPSSSMLA